MPQYIHAFVPGGTFFFTVALLERRRKLLTKRINLLRQVFQAACQRRPFTMAAMVILPDHRHGIWRLPSGDAAFPSRWHDIKARFAAQMPAGERLSDRRWQKGERSIRQRRFWEDVIRGEDDYERQVNYIHYNPVKHGYVYKKTISIIISYR
jgi:putative transposase